jgi:hypothetical protein
VKVPVDTGVLLGAVDTDDRHHEPCVEVVSQHAGQLVAPALVVAETAWMIEAALGPEAEASFVDSVAQGELEVFDLDTDDYRRCADLIRTYADLGLGLVDASVADAAEEADGERCPVQFVRSRPWSSGVVRRRRVAVGLQGAMRKRPKSGVTSDNVSPGTGSTTRPGADRIGQECRIGPANSV